MKNETGSVVSSCLMGVGLMAVGLFIEPLLMVLGALMIVTGTIAKLIESRTLKYQALEAEKQDAKLKEQAA